MNQYTSPHRLKSDKPCTKCGVVFSKSTFRVRYQNGYGFHISVCKGCERKRIYASRKARGLWGKQKLTLKTKARHAVNDAVRTGKVIKPKNCSKCGSGGLIHGHHANGYENKLDVVWLCRSCHKKEH